MGKANKTLECFWGHLNDSVHGFRSKTSPASPTGADGGDFTKGQDLTKQFHLKYVIGKREGGPKRWERKIVLKIIHGQIQRLS